MKSINWSERRKENKQTEKAYKDYTEKPVLCEVCGCCLWPWPVRLGIVQTRQKLCCSPRCAALLGVTKRGAMIGRPKNEKGHYRKNCPVCNNLMTWRATRCRNCRFGHEKEVYNNESLEALASKRKAGWKTLHAQIRTQARRIFKQYGKERICVFCGYDAYVDVAHVKAVADFPRTATLSEINHPDNLIALCPNHHSEFDNNPKIKATILEKIAASG